MVALARGRRAGLILLTAGAVMLALLLAGWSSFGIVLGPALFAIALMVLGSVCTSILRRFEMVEAADLAGDKIPRRRCGPVANWSSVRSLRLPKPNGTSPRSIVLSSSSGLPTIPPTPSHPDP